MKFGRAPTTCRMCIGFRHPLCRSAAPSLNGIPLLAASREGTASPETDFLAQLQHSDHTIRSRPSCSRSLISGDETEPWEIVYFKLCKSQILVIEQAMETTALMLGTDKSRGYYLAGCGKSLNRDDSPPQGLKPSLVLHDLRGAKAPLYHSAAGFRDFFRSLLRRAETNT